MRPKHHWQQQQRLQHLYYYLNFCWQRDRISQTRAQTQHQPLLWYGRLGEALSELGIDVVHGLEVVPLNQNGSASKRCSLGILEEPEVVVVDTNILLALFNRDKKMRL